MASIPPSDSIPKAGDVLAGKFRIERVLGVGGMGVVLAAMHIELRERVALKLLLPAFANNTKWTERFLREARAAVRIKSRNVARAYDVGRLADGSPYIAMEYLDGKDVAEALCAHGRYAPAEAVDVVLEACEAVAEAHQLGIVHRDLKPSNLFFATDANGARVVKVLDFGISKLVTGFDDESVGDLALTKTTDIMGSPLYMSPEQLVSAKDVDARSDIWALGVVLYELVRGEPPFNGLSLPELCGKILHTAPLPILDAPDGFWEVLSVTLRKDPKERFASVADLALAPFGGDAARASTDRIIRAVGAPSVRTAVPRSGNHEVVILRALPDSASPLAASTVLPGLPLVDAAANGPPTAPRQLGGTSSALASAQDVLLSPPRGRAPFAVGAAAMGIAVVAAVGFVGIRGYRSSAASLSTAARNDATTSGAPTAEAPPDTNSAVAPVSSASSFASASPSSSALQAPRAVPHTRDSQPSHSALAPPMPSASAPVPADAGSKARGDGRASSRKDD